MPPTFIGGPVSLVERSIHQKVDDQERPVAGAQSLAEIPRKIVEGLFRLHRGDVTEASHHVVFHAEPGNLFEDLRHFAVRDETQFCRPTTSRPMTAVHSATSVFWQAPRSLEGCWRLPRSVVDGNKARD